MQADQGLIVCESERLSIRQITLGDAEFLFQQLNQPSWLQNIGDRGVRNVTDAQNYIESKTFAQYRDWGYGMNLLELKLTREPIGVCGLFKREALPHPDLGFALLEGYWGHGYAYEGTGAVLRHAQTILGIPHLMAITTPANERSGKLLTKLGFQHQGSVRLTPDAEELRLYAV